MKRKSLLMVVGTICLSLMLVVSLLAGCAAKEEEPAAPAVPTVPTEAEEEVFTLKYQSTSQPGTRGHARHSAMMEQIEKMSGGRIEMDFYGVGEIVGYFEMWDAMLGGILDGINTCSCYVQGIVPSGYFFYGPPVPQMTPDQQQYLYWYLEPRSWEEVFREAALEQGGWYEVVSMLGSSYGEITSTTPIRRVADLDGVKMRAYSLVAKVWEELGCSLVTTTGAEMYTALALGTIDALNYAGGNLEWEYKLHEVAKYRTGPPIQPMCEVSVYWNLDVWNSLPPDLQEIIESAGRRTALDYVSTGYYDDFQAKKRMVEEWGVELIQFPEEDIERLTEVGLDIMYRDAREGPYADKYSLELSNILFDFLRELGYID